MRAKPDVIITVQLTEPLINRVDAPHALCADVTEYEIHTRMRPFETLGVARPQPIFRNPEP